MPIAKDQAPLPVSLSARSDSSSGTRKPFAGLPVTLLEQVCRTGFQLVTLVLLGGRLDARAFGAAAVTSAVLAGLSTVGQVGIDAAVVRLELNPSQLARMAMAIVYGNVACGAVLLGVTFGLEHGVAGPSTRMALAGAITMPLWAIGATARAQLLARRRFSTLAVAGVVGSAANAVAALALTQFSGEPFVPVASSAVAIGSSSIVYLASIKAPRISARPSMPPAVARYALDLGAFNLASYIARNGDTFLIAALLGTSATGVYDRAYALHLYPSTIGALVVGRLALLWYADADRSADAVRRREATIDAMRRSTRLVSTLFVPAAWTLSVCSTDVIASLFRDSVRPAGHLLEILSLAVAPQLWMACSGQMAQGLGLTHVLRTKGALLALGHVPAFLLGTVIAGTAGAATGVLLYSWLSLPLAVSVVAVAAGLRVRTVLRVVGREWIFGCALYPFAVGLFNIAPAVGLSRLSFTLFGVTGVSLVMAGVRQFVSSVRSGRRGRS